MLIKKENKNSITCKVSREELEARGFSNMEELMQDQTKARKFLNEILVEARETVDFKADTGTMSVSLAGLPDGSVNITINKDKPENALAAIMAKCKDALGSLNKEIDEAAQNKEDKKDPYEGVEIDTIAPRFDGKQNVSTLGQKEAAELLKSVSDDTPILLPVVIALDDLEKCITLCRELAPTNRYANSDLYKYDGRYYLSMNLTDTKLTLANSVFAIAEFSDEIANHGNMAAVLKEHGELIIGDTAIERLAEL
ncbi:MAG: adaptor protein MecA [Lachnospiraceae bacterium]|jgi:negative regulator of genetic competence, sporulation and motility|nr:adaptor protein MecA [Lachnospiraceae bacterium]